MSDQIKGQVEMIQAQIQELDQLVTQAAADLNAVRGLENVRKWKARTVRLIEERIDPTEAQRFSVKGTGPVFANDLLDELSDEVEEYRTFLVSLIKDLQQRGKAGTGPDQPAR
ncbi:MAG TPA: hypothetical protein VGQ60_01845 [Nitrospiraceae bacterium]|nr:hypothetical protein [Nitrospiraceae bacterium]